MRRYTGTRTAPPTREQNLSDPTPSTDRVSTVIVVPGEQAMVSLLGSRDELLRVIEKSLDSDVHVRGNEITITGAAADNAIAVRLFEELLELIKSGQHLTPDSVQRALGILHADSGERPAEVLSLNILSRRGKNIRPKTLEPEALRRRDRQAHRRLRHRPGRHRQDLPRRRQGRAGAAGQAGQPDHPDPSGRRSRRAARLPARHALRQDRSVPAAAARRAARHDGSGLDPAAHPGRHDRDRAAGLHARSNAERRVHHLGRGAEHHARADEDVPDPARVSARKIVVTGDITQVDLPGDQKSGLRVVRTSSATSTTCTSPT